MTTRSFIKRDEETARRFVKAYVEAIHYYLTRRAESVAIIKKYFSGSNPAALEMMYEAFAAQLKPLPAPDDEAA
jgi:ABC-type nitrate/sulfonate/bicarbonate transport system substrate-binding protein